MGRGTLINKSMKQKLNTKSSTETEVIGVSAIDIVPFVLWLANFVKIQGQDIKENILYQDNQSAMKMEKNGRMSCTESSRYVSIRHFFVKNRADKGEVSI